MSYIWINVYIIGLLAFIAAAIAEDGEPRTKLRIGIIGVAGLLWPVSITAMLFMWLMAKT